MVVRNGLLLRMGVIVVAALLLLFGLYWSGRSLLPPKPGEEEPPEPVVCDNMYKDIREVVDNRETACGLDVSGQALLYLTKAVSLAKGLMLLNASNSNLIELPDWIGTMTELRQIDVSDNKLTSLPEELGFLVNLKVLDLRGNPLPVEEVEKIRKLLPKADVKF
ncbi:MAG: leucine-rich repeat domain-containing protein [bacterium]